MAESTVSPLLGFWIVNNTQLSDLDKDVLIDLYQPILGPVATGLYLLLNNESKKKVILSERKNHMHLFALLDCGAKEFYQARIKLEALGLVKTYKNNDTLGDFYIYEIFSPLTANDFFAESLLSTLLFEKIGRTEFDEIAKKYSNKVSVLENSEDITKSFLDVFTLSNTNILDTPEVVKELQENIPQSKQNIPSIESDTISPLDWSFLIQLVSKYGVTENEVVASENVIYNLHAFYGLDELELSNLIAKSINMANNTIDKKRLERMAQTQYENRSNIVEKPVEESLEEDKTTNPLVKLANKLIPSEFLANEKRKNNGFVGSSETRVLKKLQNRNILNNSVINILINYVLQNSPTLSEGLVETVANDWSQNKVTTADEALQRISDFSTQRSNKRKNYNNSSRKIEKGTDWSKNIKPEKDTKQVDEEQLKKQAAAELKKMRELYSD